MYKLNWIKFNFLLIIINKLKKLKFFQLFTQYILQYNNQFSVGVWTFFFLKKYDWETQKSLHIILLFAILNNGLYNNILDEEKKIIIVIIMSSSNFN